MEVLVLDAEQCLAGAELCACTLVSAGAESITSAPAAAPVPRATTGSLAHVEIPSGRAIMGGVIVLVIAAGFEYELAWMFVLGCLLFLGWAGYVLVHPGES
jgi:hypothetical protein